MKRCLIGSAGVFLLGQGASPAEEPGAGAFAGAAWQAVYQGVEHAEVALLDPRPLKAQVLRVKLGTPGLTVVTTPDNGDEPGETTGLKTSGFLTKMKCQAAVNAGPFDKVTSQEGGPLELSGLQISGGKVVSKDSGYPALLFYSDGHAQIALRPELKPEIREAVAGFQVILREGKTTATDVKLHPRTAAGLSPDGKTLWLLVVDGRQVGTSEGCTTVEMAGWLKAMGAQSALNLDGGGTTTMVVAGTDGKPVILNQPIHAGIPGTERPAGSHLGIKAQPLAGAGR